MLLNIVPSITLVLVANITGLVVFAYFARCRCDPLANRDIDNPNQVNHHHTPNLVCVCNSNNCRTTVYFTR